MRVLEATLGLVRASWQLTRGATWGSRFGGGDHQKLAFGCVFSCLLDIQALLGGVGQGRCRSGGC